MNVTHVAQSSSDLDFNCIFEVSISGMTLDVEHACHDIEIAPLRTLCDPTSHVNNFSITFIGSRKASPSSRTTSSTLIASRETNVESTADLCLPSALKNFNASENINCSIT